MTAPTDYTVLPPDKTAGRELEELVSALTADVKVRLMTSDGRAFELTTELRNVLIHASKALSEGRAVSLEPRQPVLSTQEAADILGISRPTLVKLLEANELPFSKPGRHRRVKLEDILAYQQRQRAHRSQELSAMGAEAAEINAYRVANDFKETR
jgi:excisionase family DNA binding protein